MKVERYLIIATLLFMAMMLACHKGISENGNLTISQPSPILSPTISRTSETQTEKIYSSIRKVDFRNLTYAYPGDSSERITLVDGKKEQTENEDGGGLGEIEYGDVTSDGKEEAFLRIQPITGGNCQCEMVFVYTLENEKPKLLWSFDTWDRAQG